jgi:hypothetical protein
MARYANMPTTATAKGAPEAQIVRGKTSSSITMLAPVPLGEPESDEEAGQG